MLYTTLLYYILIVFTFCIATFTLSFSYSYLFTTMPKTIDYPRTSYLGAWEVAEVVDDTGGKCAIETTARKLNRKVSGSFKAIIGSAVKFGLLTSKRELLTTTNLFRRIKHAYDKQEERVYHREAFLHPPLFNQICRKFRNRELPVHMFDVMLIREFGVEEINAQSVSKAFIDGARMAGILDENNVMADVDVLAAQQAPRKELASSEMPMNLFRPARTSVTATAAPTGTSPAPAIPATQPVVATSISSPASYVPSVTAPARTHDAVSNLFGLDTDDLEDHFPLPEDEASLYKGPEAVFVPSIGQPAAITSTTQPPVPSSPLPESVIPPAAIPRTTTPAETSLSYSVRIQGPGLDTHLTVQDIDDLDIVEAFLKQIRRRLSV